MPAMLARCAAMVLIIAAALPLAGAALTMDDCYGRWEVDLAAIDWSTVKLDGDPAAAKAELIRQWQGFAIVMTPRIFRAELGGEPVIGLWRLDGAGEGTATLVVQAKGGAEQRRRLRLVAGTLQLDDLPWKLPFRKATAK